MLRDITDPDLQPLIRNPKYLKSKATKNSGFYYLCVITRIRAGLREKFISLLSNGTAERIENIEEGIMEEIAKEIEKSKEDGFDVEEHDDIEATVADEKAAREAMAEIEKPESSKRLKQAVDDFMEELTNENPNQDEDFDCEFDVDDYDENEALDAFHDDVDNAENSEQAATIKSEDNVKDDEDTIMEDV